MIGIGQSEMHKVLELMPQGHGRMPACTMTRVAYRTFQKRMAEGGELRNRVVQAERARVGDVTKLVYDLKDHEDASVRLGPPRCSCTATTASGRPAVPSGSGRQRPGSGIKRSCRP